MLASFHEAWLTWVCRLRFIWCTFRRRSVVEHWALTSRVRKTEKSLFDKVDVKRHCAGLTHLLRSGVRCDLYCRCSVLRDYVDTSQLGDFSPPCTCVSTEPRHQT